MWEVFPSVLTSTTSAGSVQALSSDGQGMWRLSLPPSFTVPSNAKYLTLPASRLRFSIGGDTNFKRHILFVTCYGVALMGLSLAAASSKGAFVLVVGLCQGMTLALTAFLLH